jgi:hypothetical protein
MLSLRYNTANFAQVTDLADFYKGQEREISRIHSMVDSIKMLFHVPGNAIKIMVAEGERIYKILFYSTSLDKVPLGWFVYLPLEDRLDLYDTSLSTEMPYIQWKNKKIVYKSYPIFLERAGIGDVFGKLTNIL